MAQVAQVVLRVPRVVQGLLRVQRLRGLAQPLAAPGVHQRVVQRPTCRPCRVRIPAWWPSTDQAVGQPARQALPPVLPLLLQSPHAAAAPDRPESGISIPSAASSVGAFTVSAIGNLHHAFA